MKLMSDSIAEISQALCKMQEELGPAVKGKKNPFFKSSYADLSACIEAIREPFKNNDLCFFQGTLPGSDGSVTIVTTISHKSGEWVRGYLDVKPVKSDPQALGSAITYGKRYGLQALSGLPTEDDDGNAASGKNTKGKIAENNQKKQEYVPPNYNADPKTIPGYNQEKVEQIKGLVRQKIKNEDWAKFCSYMQSESVEHVNPETYDTIIAALNKKQDLGG